MTISINSFKTPGVFNPSAISQIIQDLKNIGYDPLLSKAKEQFFNVLDAKTDEIGIDLEYTSDLVYELAYRRQIVRHRDLSPIIVAGDIFYTKTKKSFLYIDFGISQRERIEINSRKDIQLQLEIGFVGDSKEKDSIKILMQDLEPIIRKHQKKIEWVSNEPTNYQFLDLSRGADSRFISATEVGLDLRKLASILSDHFTRELAILIKRSGGILASDIFKRINSKTDNINHSIGCLSESGLITKEYVVICKKTSNQINRVDNIEKIDKMTEMGIMCSCGTPISEERIEELFVPSTELLKLLNQSYWMTAGLTDCLSKTGVPEDKILLNLLDGAEEIDAFVDLEGNLLMFELKDNQFSMGHAYPFGGRIGIYKPDKAIIVATKGVAPEVKEYFKQVEPASELIYVEKLEDLEKTINSLIVDSRAQRAIDLLSLFEPLAAVEIPISDLLATKIGLEPDKRRRKRMR